MTPPFAGLRVIDSCQAIGGATACMYLADYGAEVLRLEPPADEPRDRDPAYVSSNRGKMRARFDLQDHRHRRELRRLLDVADCFVTDGSISELQRAGLDGATVRAEHPRVIHAWIPAIGSTGRWSHLPPDPLFLAAVSGISDYHRATEERPVSPVVPVETYAHGALAAAGIAAALLERLDTGCGRSLVVSGLHAVAAMQAAVMVDAPGLSSPGLAPKRGVSNLPNYSAYRCGDGKWLYLGALTEAFFFAALGVIDLMDIMVSPGVDGVFANVMKPDIATDLLDRIGARFATRPRAEWLEALDRVGVPVAPVEEREEWFRSETVSANQMRVDRDHPSLGTVEMPGIPAVLSASPGMAGRFTGDFADLSDCWTDARSPIGPPTESTDEAFSDPGRPLPLRGLKVIDCASFVAGTFGPSILAHYGASVIKVEPAGGDPYRLFSASFTAINQGKRGLALDLKSGEGRAALLRMIRQADVFVENLRDRSRHQLGLEWPNLEEINSLLVHCSVGAYGRGPLSDKPGFDPLLQARSGLIAAQGGRDEPAQSTMLVHDIGTGAIAAFGILAALYHREISGRGQHVGTSLAHSSLMLQAGEFTTFKGRPAPRVGYRDWPGPDDLHRLYRCADGWIHLGAEPNQAAALHEALDLSPGRESEASEILGKVFAGLCVADVIDRLAAADIAVAKVLLRQDAFRDPWLTDNRFYHVIHDTLLGRCRVVRTVSDWPESTDTPNCRGFAVGENSIDVLEEYGFTAEEVGGLIASGACLQYGPE